MVQSLSPYDTRIVDSLGFLAMFVTPLPPVILPLSCKIPQAQSTVWLYVSASVAVGHLLDEASLVTIGLGTNLSV